MRGNFTISGPGPILPARGVFYAILLFSLLFLSITALAEDPAPDRAEGGGRVFIDVHPKARVKGEGIVLGDIAEIAAQPGLTQVLKNQRVADAPKPGSGKTMSGKWVHKMILSIRQLPDNAVINTPESVEVYRLCQTLSGDLLKNILRNYVDQRIDGDAFAVKRFKVRGKTSFPLGRLTFETLNDDPGKIGGRVKMVVMVFVDGEEAGRVSLSAWVDRYERVACANRSLPRGTILSEGDLVMTSMNTSRTPAGLVKLRGHAVGKRLKKTLKPGDYLRVNMLEAAPLIFKGDRVNLVAEGQLMSIVTSGVARGSGGKGDQIRVENISSKKIVVGRVRDRSTVDVVF